MRRRFPDTLSPLEARYAAQKLAFGPMMFQAARVLRSCGALEHLRTCGQTGASVEELAEAVGLTLYAVRTLTEAGLAAEMLLEDSGRFQLTRVGYLVLRDPMTGVNIDFVHDVCYRPMFHFEQALREARPAGLQEHGDWNTVYEGLSELPEPIRESWFAFDHFYSDGVFERALPHVLAQTPARILDVGGNTGKFAIAVCRAACHVNVTIVDLPGQLAVAAERVASAGFADRVERHAADMLDLRAELPTGHDAIWMSQFLDCFSEPEIVSILARAAAVMTPAARLYILETYWDRQVHDAARFSVINTSLYFTAVANGNSKMLSADRMRACLDAAGLEIECDIGELGYHTLWRCRRADHPV